VHQYVKYSEDQYAKTEWNQCIDKAVIFKTYEDHLGLDLALTGFCDYWVFLKHHDIPFVKANSKNLSYIPLSTFLVSCVLALHWLLQHSNLNLAAFRVVCTVNASTVLAKIITVLLAFTATVPGNRMRYFLDSVLCHLDVYTYSNYSLCNLGDSSPSIDIDAYFEHSHFIKVNNKSSVTAYYCILS
ncbi:LOW QUALITY PROTEIN: hypothetical protein U0070_025620, partial [Myodes glareolus]